MFQRTMLTLALASAFWGACGSEDEEDATALVLSVKSDLGELSSVSVRVFPASADPRGTQDVRGEAMVGRQDLGKPIVFYQGRDAQVQLVIRGLDATGNTLVEYITRASFTDSKSMAVPVFLAAACRANTCAGNGAGFTCFGEGHNGACAGACAPIVVHETIFPIGKAGDELNWTPRGCTTPRDDGGIKNDGAVLDSAVADSGAVLDSGVPGDAGDAAVCPGLTDNNPCTLFPQCGCPAGKTCTILDFTDPMHPVTSCTPPGTVPKGGACKSDSQCIAAHACVGSDPPGAECLPMCNVNSDCGPNHICLSVTNMGKPVTGFSICRQYCTKNADCTTTGCCLNPGAATASCVPAGYCEDDPATCTLEDFDSPCSSDTECCGDGTLAGHCVKFAGQTTDPFCVSRCTTSSQCGTDSCCVTWMDDSTGCYLKEYAGEFCLP